MSDNIREFMRRGVVVKTVINGMVFDGSTKDPMLQAVRDALIDFMAALSQAQAEAMKEARREGIAHAKAQPDAAKKFRGRKPSYTRAEFENAQRLLSESMGLSEAAAATRLSRATLWRIKTDPGTCSSALVAWGL